MRIGILADSHGRENITRTAVSMLNDAGAEVLIHLGDFESTDVLDALADTTAHVVWGNCDYNERQLLEHAQQLGIAVEHPMGRMSVEGKSIAFTHGHYIQLMNEAIAEPVDYLLHGHSHEFRDERIGSTRVINPGALFRAKRYTAAILDPASDDLEVITIPGRTSSST